MTPAPAADGRRSGRRRRPRQGTFQILAENSPNLIARLDPALRVLYVNRAAEAIFGVPRRQLLGRTPADGGVPPPIADRFARAVADAFASGGEQRFDFQLEPRSAGDAARHYSGLAIPEFGRARQAETALVIVYDETQHTDSEVEREALLTREQGAREQAEAAARARDQFLAIVSHELRSPLNGIQSWAHVLDQQLPAKTPLVERALAGIRTGVDQQVRLIEDLLDASRIVSGQLRLSRQPVTLKVVLDAALQSVAAAAAAKSVTVTTRVTLGTEQVYGDADRLQQIVWNLLDNAVKFVAEHGHVWLDATREGAAVLISVRDDGRGISPEFLPYLFDHFRQADSTSTRRHEGLGLGLALVRHLTELHGGRVTAESHGRGTGATFRVRLPLHVGERTAAADGGGMDAGLPSLAGLRVLLVDDQQEARDSIAALLTHAGARVDTAGSCGEALERLDTSAPTLPHVLLCDIAMPDADGYQTLRCIRDWQVERGYAAVPMPAVALTAFSLREDRIRALAAGYKMHLTKPVAPAELIVVLATVAGKARAAPG